MTLILIENMKKDFLTNLECDCDGSGIIYDKDTNSAKNCKCVKVKRAFEMIEKSDISQRIFENSLENYVPQSEKQKEAVKVCREYLKSPDTSVIFLGGSGTGKTHLTVSLMKELLLKHYKSVKYESYISLINELKMLKFDQENFTKRMEELKRCDYLIIDDMYKASIKEGNIAQNELALMYDIINYRVNQRKPMIISSEYTLKEFNAVDEAITGRLITDAKDRIITFDRKEKNYRYEQFKNNSQ